MLRRDVGLQGASLPQHVVLSARLPMQLGRLSDAAGQAKECLLRSGEPSSMENRSGPLSLRGGAGAPWCPKFSMSSLSQALSWTEELLENRTSVAVSGNVLEVAEGGLAGILALQWRHRIPHGAS